MDRAEIELEDSGITIHDCRPVQVALMELEEE